MIIFFIYAGQNSRVLNKTVRKGREGEQWHSCYKVTRKSRWDTRREDQGAKRKGETFLDSKQNTRLRLKLGEMPTRVSHDFNKISSVETKVVRSQQIIDGLIKIQEIEETCPVLFRMRGYFTNNECRVVCKDLIRRLGRCKYGLTCKYVIRFLGIKPWAFATLELITTHRSHYEFIGAWHICPF